MSVNHLPRIVDLEITNNCNFNCIFCPREHMERKKGFMSLDTLASILYKFPHIHTYILSGMGEPLLHPDIEAIVTSMKSFKKIVAINTNGSLLTKDLASFLVAAEVNNINISIHSVDKDNFYKLRRGDVDKVIENTIYCHELAKRSNTKISIQITPLKENITEIENILAHFRKTGIRSFIINRKVNRSGLLKSELYLEQVYALQAKYPELQINIDTCTTTDDKCIAHYFFCISYEGDILPCSNNLIKAEINFGNIKDIEMDVLSNAYNEFAHTMSEIEFCRKCDI